MLKHLPPYKIRTSQLQEDYRKLDGLINYQRCCHVITKYGIVIVEELNWENNFGIDHFTIFSTVINGLKYSADLPEAKLSNRSIKWYATNFMKHSLNSSSASA